MVVRLTLAGRGHFRAGPRGILGRRGPVVKGRVEGAGPRPRRVPGAVSEVEPSYVTGAVAGPGGEVVVVVGPGRTSPSLRLMINRGRNGMKTSTSAVVPALSHTSW